MNRFCFAIKMLLATVAVLCVSCGRGKLTEFSAEMVHSDPTDKSSHVAQLFVTPQKIRVENPTLDKRGPGIIIIREDKGVMQMIMPKKKTFFEIPMTKENNFGQLGRIPDDAKVKELGVEEINGFKCRKKQVETIAKSMLRSKVVKSTVWISDRLEIPVKTEYDDGRIMEVRNIKAGRQPEELFKVSSDYTKSSFPLFRQSSKAHSPVPSSTP